MHKEDGKLHSAIMDCYKDHFFLSLFIQHLYGVMVWTQSDKVQKTFIISHPYSQFEEYGLGEWTVKRVKS